jgi:hypothetical protein
MDMVVAPHPDATAGGNLYGLDVKDLMKQPPTTLCHNHDGTATGKGPHPSKASGDHSGLMRTQVRPLVGSSFTCCKPWYEQARAF